MSDLVADFKGGCLCMGCGQEIPNGSRYSQRLTGFSSDTPVTEVVCLECALKENQ